MKRGNETDVLGAFGGRLDHTLANIHNLYFALANGIRARLVSADNIVFLENKPFEITRENIFRLNMCHLFRLREK